MAKTQRAPNLQEVVNEHTMALQNSADRKKLIEKTITELDNLLRITPYRAKHPTTENEKRTLFEYFLILHVSEKYPLLHEDIFNLKQNITGKDLSSYFRINDNLNSDKVVFEIPMLFCHDMGKSVDFKGTYTNDNRLYDTSFKAECPSIPENIMRTAYESKAHMYEVWAKAVREPTIRDYYRNHEENQIPNYEFKVLWKPAISALKVEIKDKDPALLLKFSKSHYVVSTWDIPEERQISHYLKEWTRNPIKNTETPKTNETK